MRQAPKVLSAGFLALGLTLVSAALTHASEVTTYDENPFVESAFTARKWQDSKDANVKEAVDLLVDTMFKERKVREAFEQNFLFSNLPVEARHLVDETRGIRYSAHNAHGLDKGTMARILAVKWNYGYQPVVLALGTRPLSDFDETFERTGSEIDAERKRILDKRGLSEDDFYTLLGGDTVRDRRTLESDLTTLEMINDDIDRFIGQRTDQAILNKNLMEMKNSISVKNLDMSGYKLYAVSLKPIFGVVFMPRNEKLKLICFGDGL